MKFTNNVLAATILSLVVLQFSGCVTSSLVDVWHDPLFTSPPLGKVLVVAVRKDATKRRIWEDAFTAELAKRGVMATSSYTHFPDVPPDTHEVIGAVRANNYDGVVAIFRLPTETTAERVPGYTTTVRDLPYRGYNRNYYRNFNSSYNRPYWSRYGMYYREIEHPGYIDTQSVDVRAIDITTTGEGGKLIWSATSRTPDPGLVTDVQRDVVSLVISELEHRNIIKPLEK